MWPAKGRSSEEVIGNWLGIVLTKQNGAPVNAQFGAWLSQEPFFELPNAAVFCFRCTSRDLENMYSHVTSCYRRQPTLVLTPDWIAHMRFQVFPGTFGHAGFSKLNHCAHCNSPIAFLENGQ